MRCVIQRVRQAAVYVDGQERGSISKGLLVLLGIQKSDGSHEITWMSDKIANLRIFEDDNGKMNLSLLDVKAEMLIVSQFTLYGDCRKGRRPGYSSAAPPQLAEPVYERFIKTIQQLGIRTATGTFGATMEVSLINDGPVTLLVDSDKTF